MKEYSPKPDLWSKIQEKKDFDIQVKAHVPNLPQRMPKAGLWDAIEQELDRKKPVVPLWKYGMVAASIALIVALSGIVYLQFGEKVTQTELITEVDPPSAEIRVPQNEETEEVVPTFNPPAKTADNKPQEVRVNREPAAAIEITPLEINDLTIENTLISEVIIPPAPDVLPPETYHKVQISWGFQERTKLKATFGSQSPESITNSQTSRANSSNNSIKIKFQKE